MIDILIPVLGRPDNAARVAESILVGTENPHRIMFICSPFDTEQIEACSRLKNYEVSWDDHGLEHILGVDTVIVDWEPGRADYSSKINEGFRITEHEWVFQGADDLLFYPGWDTAATEASGGRFGVVGTNDLRNRAVTRGLHSTHSLFRRDYIEKYGSGTPDNTGLVLTEVYDHQYVDNEFVETAISRGEFVFAKDSHVEHLHPLWKTAESDATYEKAMRATAEDTQLYRERSARFYNQRRRRSTSR